MARELNAKCLACSKISYPLLRRTNIAWKPKPDCWVQTACPTKRSRYRNIEHYRMKLRENHRYLRWISNSCYICKSTKKLEAHHIKPQRNGIIDRKYNIMTLCHKCHMVITAYSRAIE